jgi:predicted exporter
MIQSRSLAPPPWTASGVFLGLLAFLAAAGLHPALWHLAGLALVTGVGAATASLERRRRDHTAHTAFTAS